MSKVMVVEDDPDAAEVLATALRKVGYHVLSVTNGRDALALLILDGVDLVITDLRMPQMDGVTLVTLMRSYLRFQSMPVIVLSAYAEGVNNDRLKQLWVSEVFQKGSTDLADVVRAVERHLKRQPPTQSQN